MKIRKRIALGFIGALMTLALCAGSASAVKCDASLISEIGMYPIDSITGVSDYMVYIQCRSGHSSERRYYLSNDLGGAGYATLLTAYSMGKQVVLDVVSVDWNSMITRIEVKN